MSLVNDMLKDLESSESDRKGDVNASTSSPVNGASAGDKGMAVGTEGRAQTWSKLSAFIVFFGILGIYFMWQFEPGTQADSMFSVSTTPPVEDILLNAEVLAVLDQEEEKAGLSSTNSPAAGFQNDVVSEHSRRQNQVIELVEVPEKPAAIANVENHIRTLLNAGNAALELDRLQTPKNDNAFDRFSAVLALQPDNVEAQQGLKKIQQRYLTFIKSVIKKGHYYKVPDLVKKAREVGAEQSDIDAMLDSMPASASKPAKDVIKHLESSAEDKSGSAEKQGQKVVESFASRDRRISNEAQALYSEGRILQGDALLRDFTQENPESVYALQELFDSYLSQQRLKDAEAMIDRASHLPGEIFSYMVGQLLTRRGDLQGAMRALNLHEPDLEKMPGYHALKAGLLHKMDRQSDAIVIYQQLIILDRSNASYWLGLAVSMDALHAEQALSVFEKVRQLSDTKAPYMNYVNQRIKALSKPESSGGSR